ncbi:hypothetical protein AAHA92_33682 [Salvia divinorum]|uniref:Lon N-terminal domain-containing protein n=1 Tax=Salvia divinorum TaxID=28513 RepID=A0ABD1FPR9_SALDI
MIAIISNPPPLISLLSIPNPHSSFASPLTCRRRRFQICASSLVLPLLPFPIDQVLIPSEVKSLHLYEARYIALLEESLFQKNKLFVHFVLDPIGLGGTSAEASFAARYGCLVTIEKVEKLDIGALVLIRGVGRVKLLEFRKAQPYLTGEVTPMQDNVPLNMTEINSEVLKLKEVLHNLNRLEIKLKTPREASLQTQITNSLVWAEKKITLDYIRDFIPSVAERVSFAAFQPVSGLTQSELAKLQKEKLVSMETSDTIQRLGKAAQLARDNIRMLAAKLAIQSLERQ